MRARHRVGNARFQCPVQSCLFKATRKDNLTQHVKKVHGTQSTCPLHREASHGEAQDTSDQDDNSPGTLPEYTWMSLMEATTAGNMTLVQENLGAGIDIDAQADDGRTALHCAARADQMEATHFLLELDPLRWTQKPTSFWCSVVAEAITGKSLACCKLLLQSRTNEVFVARMTTELVELDCRPQTSELRKSNTWSLMAAVAIRAVQSNDQEIVECVLESLPIEPICTQYRKSFSIKISLARLMAVEAAGKSMICVLQVLELQCPDVLSGGLTNPENPLYAATVHNQAACVRWLLRYTRKDDDWIPGAYQRRIPVGNYAFQTAAKKGFTNVLKAFLEEEPRVLPNMRNRLGRTPLHEAAACGSAKIVQMLVDHAATDVNMRTRYGWRERDTALQLAVGKRDLKIVQILLRCGRIDASRKNFGSGTPLCLAASLGYTDIAIALLEHGARDDQALFQAFQNWETSLPVVQLIVRYLAQDSSLMFDETTIQSRAHLADFLLNVKGYRYEDVKVPDIFRGWGMLHLIPPAVRENDADLLRLLLNLDYIMADDLNEEMYHYGVTYMHYRTPLNYAKSRGYTEVADLLSAHGAIDEFYDPDGIMAAGEREEALKLAAKNDESTQPAQEQPPPSEASRETPEVASQEEYDSDSELEQEAYSYIDEYISPHSNEDESERESKRQRRE